MKHKTAELEGDALDYLVQCAERGEQPIVSAAAWAAGNDAGYQPSRNWEQGGPIIERERVNVEYWVLMGERYWGAGLKDEKGHELPDLDPAKHAEMACCWCPLMAIGPTPLIAAMRSYVASRFGKEVELP